MSNNCLTVSKSNSLPPLLKHSTLLKSGWCLKESGSTFLGSKNWRRRFFRLCEYHGHVTLSYFKSFTDDLPAGIIPLDRTYSTRHIELSVKGKLHCFAVGPLVDDGSSRTYYVCCVSVLEAKEWMTAIEAAIEGVPHEITIRVSTLRSRSLSRRPARQPLETEFSAGDSESGHPDALDTEKFDKHMSEMLGIQSSDLLLPSPTVSRKFDFPSTLPPLPPPPPRSLLSLPDPILPRCPSPAYVPLLSQDEDDLDFEDDTGSVYDCITKRLSAEISSPVFSDEYRSSRWRFDQWLSMKHKLDSTYWKKVDVCHEITLARTKFSSEYPVIIKLEGELNADPQIALEYFKNAIKVGGNFDYPFRNETVLEHIPEEPEGVVLQNFYHVPIPHMDRRELTALRFWVPAYMDPEDCSGMVVTRVHHFKSAKTPDSERVSLAPSGVILRPIAAPDGELRTHCTVLMQINVRSSLQRMFKTAYNSGLLKLGLRSVFGQIKQHLEVFVSAMSI